MICSVILSELRTSSGQAGRNQVSNAVFGLEGEVMALHSKAPTTPHQYRVEQR